MGLGSVCGQGLAQFKSPTGVKDESMQGEEKRGVRLRSCQQLNINNWSQTLLQILVFSSVFSVSSVRL